MESLNGFNLVIEMLFILGRAFPYRPVIISCFNLVIEMLFILGKKMFQSTLNYDILFQSRNRDAFHFRRLFSMTRISI